jgi:FHA domain-containing protein
VEEYQAVLFASGAAILLIVVSAIVVAVRRRRRRARANASPLPLIPFSAGHDRVFGPPRPDRTVRTPASASFERPPAPTPAWSPPVVETGRRRGSPYAPPPPGRPPAAAVAAQGPAATPVASTAEPNDIVAGAAIEAASMRYWRPADGTLQFLPGRLEVIAGRDAGHEIRFVRTPGPDGTRVTFGRAEGAPYRHIQLREPTVSRTHARMTLEIGPRNGADASTNAARWRLENLSATNPVVVNGNPLAADESEQCSVMLDDGDRIEMGEVVFRFRER